VEAQTSRKQEDVERIIMTEWPSIEEYTLAHSCPTCHAVVGEPCVIRAGPPDRVLHLARQDLGMRHYNRDVHNAPFQEDRVPGQRYDSLGVKGAS